MTTPTEHPLLDQRTINILRMIARRCHSEMNANPRPDKVDFQLPFIPSSLEQASQMLEVLQTETDELQRPNDPCNKWNADRRRQHAKLKQQFNI